MENFFKNFSAFAKAYQQKSEAGFKILLRQLPNSGGFHTHLHRPNGHSVTLTGIKPAVIKGLRPKSPEFYIQGNIESKTNKDVCAANPQQRWVSYPPSPSQRPFRHPDGHKARRFQRITFRMV